MASQHPAGALQGTPDDLGQIMRTPARGDGAELEPGHVEQVGDEAVQAVRSRRGWWRARSLRESVALMVVGASRRRVPAGAGDRGERRAQIVGDRGEQRLAQAIGLGQRAWRSPRPRHARLTRSMATARLVGERIEQPPLLGGERSTADGRLSRPTTPSGDLPPACEAA